MTSTLFNRLFNSKPRRKESQLTQLHMDIAASIQLVTEEIVIKIAKSLQEETGIENICLAGGVALNCVANGKLLSHKIFKNIWIQPASGDAGTSVGAALATWHIHLNKDRKVNPRDSMKGSYLGPSYSNNYIKSYLDKINANYEFLENDELCKSIAKHLETGKVIGLLNGRMEFGPRALGGRSIIGDARNTKMQSIMNLKIKYRESFRPFAPSILKEDVSNYFEIDKESPYMLLVANVRKNLCNKITLSEEKLFGIDKLNITRSKIPAVTHVDYTARIQTVDEATNDRYYNIIKAFKERTGCSTIINTSFNVRGEPIVCTPQDAYRCFMRTEMDILILENYLLSKSQQKPNIDNNDWQKEFELD